MYVVEAKDFNGWNVNYMHTDSRVGVKTNWKIYSAFVIGGGI